MKDIKGLEQVMTTKAYFPISGIVYLGSLHSELKKKHPIMPCWQRQGVELDGPLV